jgi:hypothetical protein
MRGFLKMVYIAEWQESYSAGGWVERTYKTKCVNIVKVFNHINNSHPLHTV